MPRPKDLFCKSARIGIPRVAYYDKTTPPGADKPRFGLNPEQIVKLFQDFTQADPSTTRKFGGNGTSLRCLE